MVGTACGPRATKGMKLPGRGLQGEKAWAEGQRDGILQGHVGPRGNILFKVLCPTSSPTGGTKKKRSIWICKGGTCSGLTVNHTLHLSLCLSYLKVAPIFLQ